VKPATAPILHLFPSSALASALTVAPVILALVVLAASLAVVPQCLAARIVSPSEYLGKQIGADGVLADYGEISRYYRYLDSASDWIDVVELGPTTLGKPFIMAVASEPANLADLDRYREITRTLRDARGTSAEEAAALAKEGKVFLLDMSAIHSDEVGATQMALELAWKIASDDPEVTSPLRDVILLIMPCINPDGHDMYVKWYYQWKGTEYDGGWLPMLYHPYAGHDNNRDWYMFNLQETRLISEVLYQTYLPQVALDHHQMWMTGARLFVPPYSDPVNPNLDPILWREIELVGAAMHLNLQEDGLSGVIHNSTFPGWWEGAVCMTPLWHNIASLLTEAASCRVATPVYVDPSELDAWGTGFPKYTRLSNFPDPWPGGWWRLQDIIDYDLSSVVGALEACSKNKETLLANFYRMAATSLEKGKTEKPYAFVFPPGGDHFTLARMLERLMLGGVEVSQATEDFTLEGRTMPAGSHVIFMSQPYRAYAKDMLERQHYPEIRLAPEAPPLEPYDATAWTMPLKMGVEAIEAREPFEATTMLVERIEPPASVVPRAQGGYLTLPRTSLAAYTFANRALKEGLEVLTATGTLETAEGELPPGTLLTSLGRSADRVTAKVRDLSAGLGLAFGHATAQEVRDGTTGAGGAGRSDARPLKPVRLGIYEPYLENEGLGWLKYALEDFEFDYRVLRNEDVKRGHLAKTVDAIIIHDANPGIIKDGRPTGWGEEFFEPFPPGYSGGLGDEGVKALKTFVEEGGTLIATASACDFALDALELPASDALKDLKEKDFSCPGAIVNLEVDPASELGWGMPPLTPCLFFYSKAFSTRVPYGKFGRAVAAKYAERDLLLSGWVHGQERIAGKPAVVEFNYGGGRVVVSGFDPVHRAQTYSTYRIIFNAILR
jgi:hypothetical protein